MNAIFFKTNTFFHQTFPLRKVLKALERNIITKELLLEWEKEGKEVCDRLAEILSL